MEMLSIWKEFGLVGLMCGSILIILALLMNKAFAVGNKILDQSNDQSKAFMKIYSESINALDAHTAMAKEFHTEVRQAHDYQRREHESQLSSLMEIEKALGRINGYKHD
jgi:hypothetical protein